MPPDPEETVEDPQVEEPVVVEVETDPVEEESDRVSAQEVVSLIAQDVESMIDRRVTRLMHTLQKDYGLRRAEARSEDPPGERQLGDLRERLLKSAIAEEIGLRDWHDTDEQKTARSLAFQAVEGRSFDGDDYQVATSVVDQVAGVMQQMRDTYQAQLRSDLKRRGVLRDEEEEPSPGRRSGNGAPQTEYDRGANRAREQFKSRLPE